MSDLTRCGDFVASPHPGIFLCFFEVLFVKEFVEGFIVFAGVFCLEGTEGDVGIDVW